MTHNGIEPVLEEIISEVSTQIKRGGRPTLVFDLDSTLFEVHHRTAKILEEFLNLKHLDVEFVRRAKKVVIEPYDWGIKSAFVRVGFTDFPEPIKKEMILFWRERFFSDDYLELDHPSEGAVEFVNEVHDLGAHILYLTGRDTLRMGKGTHKTLKKWGFPVLESTSDLVMKPKSGIEDVEYKVEVLRAFEGAQWFFENEPKILHAVEKHYPQLRLVWLDTTHSGQAEPQGHWTRIRSFKRK